MELGSGPFCWSGWLTAAPALQNMSGIYISDVIVCEIILSIYISDTLSIIKWERLPNAWLSISQSSSVG
jgi:hypothetical protein